MHERSTEALIASRCTEPESGGRRIDAILTNTMQPSLPSVFLTEMLDGEQVGGVHGSGGLTYAFT